VAAAIVSLTAMGLLCGNTARTAAPSTSLASSASAPGARTFSLQDTKDLVPAAPVKAEPVVYQGRKAVRITMGDGDHDGMVVLPGSEIQDGIIEVDLAWKKTLPPGVRYPGFIGIAFRVNPDASHYELFYLRPGNVDAPDQLQRNHVVQYTSEPDNGWYRLRREWPAVYEAHAEMEPEKWTRVKISLEGRTARLYVNGAAKPNLIVDGLKGQDLRGAVGLWGYTNQESYFSNLRITPAAKAQSVKNGSEIAGSWDVGSGTDAGPMEGRMTLSREGAAVKGTWSGTLGDNCAVTGTWRDGYVELSFHGDWSSENKQGAPGPVTAYMSGWIDGADGKGRMRVDGHADGAWVARRKE